MTRFQADTQAFTWQQLGQLVCAQADLLDHRLDTDGDSQRCIGYASDNSLGDVLIALACPLIDAMEIPIDHRLGARAKQLASQVGGVWIDHHHLDQEDAGFGSDPLQRIHAALPKTKPDDPALILWTSGTTAESKAVTLTHRNLVGNARAKLKAVPNSASDVRLTSLPLCHAYARTCDLGTWLLSGCTMALGLGMQAWRFMGPQVQPTVANVVPSLANRLYESDAAEMGLDRLRLLGCGGAALSQRDFCKWSARGVTIIQGYGLTESSPVICSATPENSTAGMVGGFVDGWERQIRDGRLFVRGPHVMSGYWNDLTATRQKIVDGWLDTGDIVQLDPATSQLRILGRADDVIVLDNGHKIHPQSIERQIEQIDGVRHALIVPSGRTIDVWLDADDANGWAAAIEKRLADRPPWEQPASVHCFEEPLSAESGDLTAKGTIRRRQVMRRLR
ncbi:Long-chain-fatty-acid--CoA ligase [Planctomycetes bacterium K23_9]|uniref:Long-chain-fatty-acid--CoA ligase n=1 Tax=Stieleria marina TaxID=1930275 RepID=A0A517NZB2_9BACT|nr:Long-chain-fatty-acid--CoA ligase [Planctomycetes bacterium K23_9]